MATKKITFKEFRSLLSSLIKEELGEASQRKNMAKSEYGGHDVKDDKGETVGWFKNREDARAKVKDLGKGKSSNKDLEEISQRKNISKSEFGGHDVHDDEKTHQGWFRSRQDARSKVKDLGGKSKPKKTKQVQEAGFGGIDGHGAEIDQQMALDSERDQAEFWGQDDFGVQANVNQVQGHMLDQFVHIFHEIASSMGIDEEDMQEFMKRKKEHILAKLDQTNDPDKVASRLAMELAGIQQVNSAQTNEPLPPL